MGRRSSAPRTWVGRAEEGGALSSIPAAMTFDASGNILVGCATGSLNFPVRAALQSTSPNNGNFATSGFLSKLDPTLSTLIWSTYLGGSGNDQVHDVRVAANGTLFVCGQTTSPDLPTSATALHRTLAGGLDGFVLNLNATGSAVLAATYLGTPADESARFLDFDSRQRVCVAGESTGPYPITAGVLSAVDGPGGQAVFLHCLSADLSTTAFSTRFGASAGRNSFDSVLSGVTAFALTDCDQLMFSAYATPDQPLPTTADAFSSTFRSIYLCALNPEARSLSYGSYFGSANHLTTHLHPAAASQITRTGILTHIECSTSIDYPTSAGAYAPRKLANGNDGAIFKYSVNGALASDFKATLPAVAAACAPYNVQFANTSVGAKSFRWLFGDGSAADTARSPSHVFAQAGTYQVLLITARPPQTCGPALDTARTTVTVRPVPPDVQRTALLDCTNDLTLDAGVDAPGYAWSTGEKTRTIARVNKPGHYTVQIQDPASCPYLIDFDVVRDDRQVLLPNIITPNGDKLNETFTLPAAVAGSALKIFNRWGRLVYQHAAYANDWRGEDLPAGIYYYEVRSSSACVGVLKGWVELAR